MAITPKAPGQISAPNTLTGEAVGNVAAPNTLTGEAVGNVAAPNTLTGEAVGNVAAPNTLTGEAVGTVSAPNTLTGEAVGVVSAPNTLVGEAVGSVSAPNTLTANAAGSVSAPNTLTGKAVGSVSAPNTLVGVTPAAFPRTLTPLVDMNFATRTYAQSGTPVAFDDLFTYSRASSATFTNRVAKATGGYDYFLDTDYVGDVTNLLTYSEQFDNAAWSKAGGAVTVQANFAINPFGDKTADQINFSGASEQIAQAASITIGQNVVGSVWLKGISGQTIRIDTAGIRQTHTFNGLWELVTVKKTSATKTAINFNTYSATARVFLAWGFQVTESDSKLPYVKTLDAPVTKTFTETLRTEYDPATGEALGALIEGGSTNLALWSEDFSNAAWFKSRSSIMANTTLSPDNTLSADKLIEDGTAGNYHFVRIAKSVTVGTEYSISIYAKANTRNIIWLGDGITNSATKGAWFNLSTGQIGTIRSGWSADIKDLGNGWFKCSVTGTSASTAWLGEIALAENDGSVIYNGDNTSGVYIWGAQIEALPFASSYIRTEGAAVSRSSDSLSVGAENISDQDSTFNIDFKLLGTNTTFEKIFAHDGSFGYYSLYIAPNNYALKSTIGVSTSGTYKTTSANERNKITGVYSYSDGTFSGYSGGDFVFVNSIQTFTKNNANAMTIGAASSTTQFTFGHISKFATYDKALTAQEITLL